MPLLRPPAYQSIEGPLAFLAGPIQGADRWQEEAARLILFELPDVYVASPRRSGDIEGGLDGVGYAEQVDWEGHHLARAAAQGVIVFWLAAERAHECSRAYAQTTRFELAEWFTRSRQEPVVLAVGAEEGFPGARYIRYRLGQAGHEVHGSLAATCAAAVTALRGGD